MKKKLTAVALIVALLAVAVIGGSLAYFSDSDTADNEFTVGNVKVDLTEPGWEESGKEDAKEAYPTEALKKDPTVENTGANPCFVRIKLTGLDALKKAGLSESLITYETNYVTNALGENWVLHEDGYFYYTKVLAVGEKTSALFDQIRMPADATNGDAETIYMVNVTAQAVQAQGAKPSWSAVQSMSVEEIAAWFTTCGLS